MESLMTQEVVTSSIKVKIISTTGVNKKVLTIGSEVVSWKQLKNVFDINDVLYKDMSIVIGETNVSLELDEAKLPTTDFTLFMLPKKVDSGLYNQAQLDSVQKTFASKKGAIVCAAKIGLTIEDYLNIKNILKGKKSGNVEITITASIEDSTEPTANLHEESVVDRLHKLYENLLLDLDKEDDTMIELNAILKDFTISNTNENTNLYTESEAEKAIRLDREETVELLAQANKLQSLLNK